MLSYQSVRKIVNFQDKIICNNFLIIRPHFQLTVCRNATTIFVKMDNGTWQLLLLLLIMTWKINSRSVWMSHKIKTIQIVVETGRAISAELTSIIRKNQAVYVAFISSDQRLLHFFHLYVLVLNIMMQVILLSFLFSGQYFIRSNSNVKFRGFFLRLIERKLI